MTLVHAETGEVVAEFTEDEAREHTDRINLAVGIAGDLVIEAWERRIWTTLGYSSWEDYCRDEIRFEATGQSKAVLMVGLRKAGASYRAIGAATGVSHEKARQELSGVNELTPEADVTGTDGKTYPAGRLLALRTLAEHGPLTDFELADITGKAQTSIGCRRADLKKAGLAADTGQRRASPSGSPAIVWALTIAGRQMAAES